MSEVLRFFLPGAVFREGQPVQITGETLHHMQQVLRLQVGVQLLLLDGAGMCCQARLESLSRREAQARVLACRQVAETALPVTIMQALPKGDKFDLVLQKGTELGVGVFQPLVSARSIPRPDPSRLQQRHERWQRIVREAARQSRRDLLPEVRPLQPLVEAVAGNPAELRLILWEEGARPLAACLPEQPPASVSILIGPEGGLTAEEVAAATRHGFQPVHLGPRVLRTETAGLAVAPVLQYLYGDWHRALSDIQTV